MNWIAVIIAGLATYLSRVSFIALGDRISLPPVVESALRYVGPAAFAAISIPIVLGGRRLCRFWQRHPPNHRGRPCLRGRVEDPEPPAQSAHRHGHSLAIDLGVVAPRVAHVHPQVLALSIVQYLVLQLNKGKVKACAKCWHR